VSNLKRLAGVSDIESMSNEELYKLALFMSKQVPTLEARDVAYATYVVFSLQDIFTVVQTLGSFIPLYKALLISYRKNLIDWMNYALVARADRSKGGQGIKTVEKGLASFVNSIPSILTGHTRPRLSVILPETEWLDPNKLDPIGNKIIDTVRDDAIAAKVLPSSYRAARTKYKFTVKWDEKDKVWYIPFEPKTYEYYDQLAVDGFKANRGLRRWERTRDLEPGIYQSYNIEAPSPTVYFTDLQTWYSETWLPKNINRFSKVFTTYAKSEHLSYQLLFSLVGKEVKVKFKRDVQTPAEAIEELRYRYLNRHGREPWLEVLNKFAELIAHTTPDQDLMEIIDRINNLQHSNGLFMEHFPSDVQNWYLPFLNAKYHTPKPYLLAKYIKDSDLRDVLVEVGLRVEGKLSPVGYHGGPAPTDYQGMEKELPKKEVNWRKLHYPKYKGVPAVERFDPRVQHGLEQLRKMQEYTPLLEGADPEVLHHLPALLDKIEAGRLRELPQSVEATAKNLQDLVEARGLFTPEEIKPFLGQYGDISRDAKRLLDESPNLPMSENALRLYKKWVQSLQALQDRKKKLDVDVGQFTKQREQERRLERAQEGWQGEWERNPTHEKIREHLLSRTARMISRVAYRHLIKRSAP
jgi:hypothetical protein